jgi:hypothetical protein
MKRLRFVIKRRIKIFPFFNKSIFSSGKVRISKIAMNDEGGAVSVPITPSALKSDKDVLPVRVYRIMREA